MQTKNENKENLMPFISKKISIDINQLKNILSPNNKHGVCGSVNLGNTCYMNSSIACISNCTELTTFFLTKEYKKYKNTSNKNGLNGKLADGWYLLLKDYWKGDKTYGNPKVIKKLIAKKDKKFEDDEQQDANEFIVIFLEILGEDLNTVKQKTYYEMEEQRKDESDIQCAKRFWEFHYSRNNSIIMDLFCGLNKSTIICPVCKFKSVTFIPFSSLSLLIPNEKKIQKIRYENYPLVDISIWYIPLYSLAMTYRLNIRINKKSSFKDILTQIKEKIKDFPFKITDNVDIISVKNKMIDEILDINIQYDNRTYNDSVKFIIEKEIIKDKKSIFIPVYLKLGEHISTYPRGIYIYEGMSYGEFKSKVFILIRKYFYSFKKTPETKELNISQKLKTINSQYDYMILSDLPNLLKKEYKILNALELDIKLKYPYNIYIQKSITTVEPTLIFDGENDHFENLSPYEISSNESQIDILATYLQNMDFILVIKMDDKNPKYRESIGNNLDKCIVLKSEDYCKNDYLYTDENNGQITLDDCLYLFNMEEKLEAGNEWFCKRCKNHVKAQKKLQFFYLPKILCLCLSRFEKIRNDYHKNEKLVEFPINNLNMNKYMIKGTNMDYIYDIFAVCEHFGNRDGGHYTAICKNYDGYWYSYDDSECARASEKEVCSKNAYVLFYRRKNW